jgi:hypothetical protein
MERRAETPALAAALRLDARIYATPAGSRVDRRAWTIGPLAASPVLSQAGPPWGGQVGMVKRLALAALNRSPRARHPRRPRRAAR